MDGMLLADKPGGISSAAALERIKRRLGVRSAGHTGTLDPRATGLLVVLLGRATKLAPFLEGLEKEYETTIRLGVTTDTDDLDGAVLAERPVRVDRAALEAALARFTGSFEQRPPDYSAVKIGGVRAYRRARGGRPLRPPARPVTVHALELVGLEPLRLRIVCSAGTYVRALARDLGEALGCGGAVEALRRTRVGPFRVEKASDQVYPVEQAVGFLPPVLLSEEERRALVDGKPVPAEGTGLVRVSGPAGFVGVGRLVEGRLQAERVLYNR